LTGGYLNRGEVQKISNFRPIFGYILKMI